MYGMGAQAQLAETLNAVRKDARTIALHLMHDHPVTGTTRHYGTINVRTRSHLHMLPRLWHREKLFAHFLKLPHPLWLGEDGVIYHEYEDLLGNSYFMEAEFWRWYNIKGMQRIKAAIRALDPCTADTNT